MIANFCKDAASGASIELRHDRHRAEEDPEKLGEELPPSGLAPNKYPLFRSVSRSHELPMAADVVPAAMRLTTVLLRASTA